DSPPRARWLLGIPVSAPQTPPRTLPSPPTPSATASSSLNPLFSSAPAHPRQPALRTIQRAFLSPRLSGSDDPALNLYDCRLRLPTVDCRPPTVLCYRAVHPPLTN